MFKIINYIWFSFVTFDIGKWILFHGFKLILIAFILLNSMKLYAVIRETLLDNSVFVLNNWWQKTIKTDTAQEPNPSKYDKRRLNKKIQLQTYNEAWPCQTGKSLMNVCNLMGVLNSGCLKVWVEIKRLSHLHL